MYLLVANIMNDAIKLINDFYYEKERIQTNQCLFNNIFGFSRPSEQTWYTKYVQSSRVNDPLKTILE